MLLPPAVPLETVAELNDGLVCLSGCARDGFALRDPRGAARLAAFGRERFYVELQRPYERGDARRHARSATSPSTSGSRRSRRGTSTRTLRGRTAPGHARRDPLPHLARRLRAERRGNREAVLRSPAEMVERFAGIDCAAAVRTGALAERRIRSHRGARLPVSGLLRPRRPRDPTADRDLRPGVRRALSRGADCYKQRRARLDGELALIGRLGLAGFFLLHHEVLELAARCALEVKGRDSPRMFLPPGRGRGSVGSIVCYLTGLSHVDPVENDLSLGRFINHELTSVPDIDLDFPRDIREKLIVRVTERYGQGTPRSSRASRRTARGARSVTSARRWACLTRSSSGSPA